MSVTVRTMTRSDLATVNRLASAAFGSLRGLDTEATGETLFNPLLVESRFRADPAGCLVASLDSDADRPVGAVLSVARGPLAWFGPLAVHPSAQRAGIGAVLVDALLQAWSVRGVSLMGLETFADSEFHVRFYGRFGFRPSWTGLAFTKVLGRPPSSGTARPPRNLEPLDFLLPGLDVGGEARATAELGIGAVLVEDDGVAICHLEPTFQGPHTGYVPFLAARDRATFDHLLDHVELLSAARGQTSVFVRASGSSWGTLDALAARGYRAGRAMVRMKAGADPDYDRGDRYYLDNWL